VERQGKIARALKAGPASGVEEATELGAGEDSAMRREKSDYAIQTVTNALRLLEAFEVEEELGVTELSHRLDLHKNNVFRLLATLEQKAYVEKSAHSERYRLGPRCLALGQSLGRIHRLVRRARSSLRELARDTSESAHLGVLRDFEVVHLDGEQAERLVQSALRVGRRLPCHCTALGKVLIAFSPADVQEAFDRRVIGQGRLERHTPVTQVDREKLLEHLRTVAHQGWASDLEECEPGLCCVAAPVFAAGGDLVAALSVSGPAFRLSRAVLEAEVAPVVVAAAERLSRELGYGL
jgi:DNA-binding IclR family transcriptional regulator